MVSAFWFFGNLGGTIFALIGGFMFDKISPSAPFSYMGVTDMIVFVFAITLLCMGKLNNY